MGHAGSHEISRFIDTIYENYEKVPHTVWFFDRKAITQRFDHSTATFRVYSALRCFAPDLRKVVSLRLPNTLDV